MKLRPASRQDLDFVLAAEADPDARQWIIPWSEDKYLAALADLDVRCLIIEHDEHRVGFVLLAGLTNPDRSIELKRIVVTSRGLGLGRQAVELVIALCFDELAARRLWLDVKPANSRALSVYEKVGFQREGPTSDDHESLVIMTMRPVSDTP